MCVCERECVCVREKERERVCVCAYVCLCVRVSRDHSCTFDTRRHQEIALVVCVYFVGAEKHTTVRSIVFVHDVVD